jgi:hypothetical protein
MGKKRIVKQEGQRVNKSLKDRALSRVPKKNWSAEFACSGNLQQH